jgi:hypothetical protein
MNDRCEHGYSLYEACDECGRFDDGSDGTMAGDHRALVKRWLAELERQKREREANEEVEV